MSIIVLFLVCVVPGEWMEWGSWGLCSVTCGGGTRQRSRECDMTTHGDMTSECEGDDSISEPCHQYSCTPSKRFIILFIISFICFLIYIRQFHRVIKREKVLQLLGKTLTGCIKGQNKIMQFTSYSLLPYFTSFLLHYRISCRIQCNFYCV